MHWRTSDYCSTCPHNENKPEREYKIVVMDAEGKITIGKTYESYGDVCVAINELSELYKKHGIPHRVGYMEV